MVSKNAQALLQQQLAHFKLAVKLENRRMQTDPANGQAAAAGH